MGTPASHGCIRMRNDAVIRLFDQVPVGTRVTITD
jgi:lipoprotein-anchoring transpeptidase ErfK/SrfK